MQSNLDGRTVMQHSDNITARIGRWSTQHRNTAIFGWLAFVLASLVIGMSLVPQKQIDQQASGPGESGEAGRTNQPNWC